MENEKKPIGFDPMTGEPIYEEPAKDNAGGAGQPTGFDPMTGEPIYGDVPKAKAPFQVKKAVVIPVAIAAAGVVVFAGVKTGAFLPKSGKVLRAVENTLAEELGVVKNLKGIQMLRSDDYTVTFSGSVEDELSGELTFSSGSKQKQISGTVDIGPISDIGFIGNLTKDEAQLQIPGFSDEIYTYNYRAEKDGYLTDVRGKSELEAIDQYFQTIYSFEEKQKQGTSILGEFYKGLEFKSVDKEEFEIDGKDRQCKGYQTTLNEDNLSDLLGDLEDLSDETYPGSGYVFDYMRDSLESFEMDVTVYIYKGKLACVMFEEGRDDLQLIFHGGETRTQNVEVCVNGDTIWELEGETDKNKEQYEISSYGITLAEFEHDSKSGEYQIELYDDYYGESIRVEGVLKGGSNSLDFSVDRLASGENRIDIDFNVSLKKGAEFQKISGGKFDVGNASESDLLDLAESLEEYYYY